ncbi:MAG TPA: FkbM family methyltransferase [Thermoanaerobaculia bacterium]|nr:FkbM family methyltransferase [Thermoanaerobaculia bacterium]
MERADEVPPATTQVDFEARVQAVYEALLGPGDVAVDVGAHLGRHLIPIAQAIAPTGRVLAFEPLPMCRESLARRFEQDLADLASLVTVHGCALGDISGETEFVIARDAIAYSGLRERVYDVPTALDRIPIEVRRLDEFTRDLSSLSYVKIDAEGGELHILRGGSETLARFRPAVTFEFGANSIGNYGVTVLEMGDFWLERGYRLYDILGRPLATREAFADSATAQHVWDYVALPAEAGSLPREVFPQFGASRET